MADFHETSASLIGAELAGLKRRVRLPPATLNVVTNALLRCYYAGVRAAVQEVRAQAADQGIDLDVDLDLQKPA
jgi:hypothetical protein